MKKGKIVQVMGPVVDVEFEDNDLPYIKDALEVDNHGKRCVMEVAQHIGNNTVRCIMLAASEGLHKDMEVIAEGSGIKVPVGAKTLGRLFNVLGDTLDGGENLDAEEHWVIHRDPPSFEDQSPVVEILETGINVICIYTMPHTLTDLLEFISYSRYLAFETVWVFFVSVCAPHKPCEFVQLNWYISVVYKE